MPGDHEAGQYPGASGIFCGVDTHAMPITILGNGRSGLANKFSCLVHVCKLEVSGDVSKLQIMTRHAISASRS